MRSFSKVQSIYFSVQNSNLNSLLLFKVALQRLLLAVTWDIISIRKEANCNECPKTKTKLRNYLCLSKKLMKTRRRLKFVASLVVFEQSKLRLDTRIRWLRNDLQCDLIVKFGRILYYLIQIVQARMDYIKCGFVTVVIIVNAQETLIFSTNVLSNGNACIFRSLPSYLLQKSSLILLHHLSN